MSGCRNWLEDKNDRSCDYKRKKVPLSSCEKEHVTLSDLKRDKVPKKINRYLGKDNIPYYPEFVIETENVCHVTGLQALSGIIENEGFKRGPYSHLLCWSLSVPKQSRNNMYFWNEFATSPAFQTESRYGNFRFTIPFRELLREYSKFCRGSAPVLRVFDTKVYKQEIVYTILVHPQYMTHYGKYPRLPVRKQSKKVCGYGKQKIFWHCQSPSNGYKYCLAVNAEDGQEYAEKLESEIFSFWDNVVVAFHMKWNWVLRCDRWRLFKTLSACETAPIHLSREPKMSLNRAEYEIRKLKNYYDFY